MTDKVFTHDALLERIEVVKPTFEEIYADWFHEISRWCRVTDAQFLEAYSRQKHRR